MLVILRVIEKARECRYHVVEKIVDSNFNFDFVGYIMQIRTDVIVEKLISIISLIKVEVALDGLLKRLGQRLPIVEPLKAQDPVV